MVSNFPGEASLSEKHQKDLAEKKLLLESKRQEKLDRLRLKQQQDLARARIKARTKRTKVLSKTLVQKERAIKRITPAPMLSQEQGMLREMFGGSAPLWGSGQNLPKLHNTLISGGGLVKSGDRGETASMFGF